jgi:hypothetical protein
LFDRWVGRQKNRRQDALQSDLAALGNLPARRTTDFTELVVRVTRTGGFLAHNVFYSAPARLIGHRLRVHVGACPRAGPRPDPWDDRIEAYLGSTHVVSHPRARARNDGRRVHVVDYRHVIHALKRKPQALAGSVYRDGLFPRSEYTAAWQRLSAGLPRKDACRRMVALLALAYEEACEAELAALIAGDLAAGTLPDAGELRARLRPRHGSVPADVPVVLTALSRYDSLLEGRP